jgi:transcriptional regulator with XRE-family HTH domain
MARKSKHPEPRPSPAAKARATSSAASLEAAMPLANLRKARALSQEALAGLLHITQPEVSRVERSTDLYVSTLRRFLAALGGDLRIVAVFPDGEVELPQFSNGHAAGHRPRVGRVRGK